MSNPNFAFLSHFASELLDRERVCLREYSRALMRRMMSTSTFSSLLCSSNSSNSFGFFSGNTTAALWSRRVLFPIASSSSSGGEFSSSLVLNGRRRFRGRERGRFGGGNCEENTHTTTKYNTTHPQKRGFVLASTNGIQNNEQLKLFSVSSSL